MTVIRCLIVCLCVAAFHGRSGAQHQSFSWPSRPCPCPPAARTAPVAPGSHAPGSPVVLPPNTLPPAPGTQPTPSPGTTPTPEGAAAGAAAAGAVAGGGGEGGSSDLASGSPNMFGDAFAGRTLRIPLTVFAGNVEGFVRPEPAATGRYVLQGEFDGAGYTVTRLDPVVSSTTGVPAISSRFGTITLVPAPSFTPAGGVVTLPFSGPFPNFPLAESPQVTAAVRQANPGTAVRFLDGTAQNVASEVVVESTIYSSDAYMRYALFRQVEIILPSPSSGGVVGRTKIADDNSPLPRDRVIFNYDYFNNAAIGTGVDVHRISPGFEKTFFNQLASAEVRFPFAATLDSTFTSDGLTGRAMGLGNVNITLKGLLYQDQTLAVAAGFGVALPTAADTRARLADGTDLARVRNQAAVWTPYVAALYMPDSRLFAQLWAAVTAPGRGNTVEVNTDFTGLRKVGRIDDQPLAQFDGQIGYWLYRAADRSARLQGLAPFLELHYNATVGQADVVSAGLFQVGSPGSLNELNLTAGVATQLGDNFLLHVAAVVPLKGGRDQTFDYQLGIRGSYFFGATARSRTAVSRVSTY